MAIQKFKCTVTRIDEYQIELDDQIVNEEWMKEYSHYFHKVEELSELAESLAQYQARVGERDGFIEGFGWVTRNGKLPWSHEDFDENGNWKPIEARRKASPGINIAIVDEDNDCEVEVEKLKADG